VIYCCSGTAREERAVVGRLRAVATKQGWTVIKAFVDRPGAGRPQWVALSRALAAREADLLMVPSFAGIGESVSDVLEEIVRLRDAGCDLYVHDADLDTTSPIDRVLFRIVDALRSVERAEAKRPAAARGRAARTKTFEATPYEHSVIRGALSSGLKPREVAKLLKVPLGLVQVVAKDE
jgi:DNA invertase Pin-like site-specific DNA recombinase